jgi:Endonuclease I/Secretion system C-terminal sorting domain
MSKIIFIYFLFFLSSLFSQIPLGYYNSATGSGFELKTQLHTIIKNYNPRSYNALWNLYSTAAYRDNYYENDASLLDIYSEKIGELENYNYTSTEQQCGFTTTSSEGLCYNREHLIPESFFEPYFITLGIDTSINSLNYYTKNDANFIYPTDIRVNAWRGNLPFGRVNATVLNSCAGGDASPYLPSNLPCQTTNTSKVGFNNNSGYSAGYSGNVFEPINEFKGDVARSVLYFAVRYENILELMYTSCSNTTAKAMFNSTAGQSFNPTFLNILKTWHLQDPVSDREIAINNKVYLHQNNRNPFIDNPTFVSLIWGNPLVNDQFELASFVSIYPNPSNVSKINIETETALDQIELVNMNGQVLQQISKPIFQNNIYTLENLPKGFNFLKLKYKNQSVIKKVIIN